MARGALKQFEQLAQPSLRVKGNHLDAPERHCISTSVPLQEKFHVEQKGIPVSMCEIIGSMVKTDVTFLKIVAVS